MDIVTSEQRAFRRTMFSCLALVALTLAWAGVIDILDLDIFIGCQIGMFLIAVSGVLLIRWNMHKIVAEEAAETAEDAE